MKYIKLYILVFIINFLSIIPLYGMLSKINPATLKRVSAIKRAGQQRTLYTPERLKGLYTPLTVEAQKVSPLHGAVEFETKAIERRYGVESEAFGPQLVRELFFQQESQFRPTVSKSKAAYSLSPEILGLVIGALETGRLQEQTVRNYIIDQWQNEYRKITEDKKPFSRGKIEKLLILIESTYNHDKDNCRKILLGFLYAKALPDNDHDMIHYLAGLNEFINVFTDQSSSTSKLVTTYIAEKKDIKQPEQTFFDKLKFAGYAIKNYISGSSSNVYQQKDYKNLYWNLEKTSRSKAVEEAIHQKFELTVSAMLNKKRSRSLYPSKIIQSSYGYRGKHVVPNCVEAAIQDLFNIILYNSEKQSFDLSLLPSALSLNENFKQFYLKYDPSKINSKECGQAFMDLVSGIKDKGIYYALGDYELSPSKENLLGLANYFFGSNAQNLNELGAALSSEKRKITFVQSSLKHATFTKIITMTIKDKQINTSLEANFYFTQGHGWLDVPIEKRRYEALFTPEELAKNNKVSSKVQALLMIEPMDFENLMQDYSGSFYYALPTDTDDNKEDVILAMSSIKSENVSTEVLDYAFHLYQQLPSNIQEKILPNILKIGIDGGIWLSYPKLKKIIIENYKIALRVASKKSLVEYTDFINEISKELPNISKEQFVMDVLQAFENPKIVTTAFIITLCDQITDKIRRRELLKDLLLFMANTSFPWEWKNKIDFAAIVQVFTSHDNTIFTNATNDYQGLLLSTAIRLQSSLLVESLIKNGISIDTRSKENRYRINITPLGLALMRSSEPMVKFLLEHGANPNAEYIDSSGNFGLIWMLMQSFSYSDRDILELLLQYGANITARNSKQETILDIFNNRMNNSPGNFLLKEMKNILLNAGAKTSAQLLEKDFEDAMVQSKQKQLNRE